jgi:O-antigen/teichoic acid export membrane protein
MGERIRLRYSGLVLFAARIIGTLVGLGFLFFVVKNLSTDEVGAWTWISRIVSYTLIPAAIVNFWVGRFVARDPENSKTALVVNTLLMLPFLVSYIILIPVLSSTVQASYIIYLAAALLIPLNYLAQAMSYVGGAIKPEYYGYSEIVYEPVKLFFAFVLVVVLDLAVLGAVLTVEIALAMQFLSLIILSRRHFHSGFRKDVAKQWLSYSWLSGYISESTVLLSFDAAIVVALVGAQLSSKAAADVLAYFGVALSVSALVGLAGAIAGNLTTKLLRGGGAADVEVILKMTLLFGIPILAGGFLLARPIIYIFPPTYLAAVSIVRVLMLSVFLDMISSIADSVVQGTVNVDRGKAGFKQLAKSKLFLLPSINFLTGASYLIVLYLVLSSTLAGPSPSSYQLAFLWSIVLLLIKLPFVLYKFWLSKKVSRFRIPYKAIAKYSIGAIAMGIVLIYMIYFTPFLVYDPSKKALEYIPYPLTLIGIGAITYLAVMLAIDKEFRQLVSIVLSSIRSRRRDE